MHKKKIQRHSGRQDQATAVWHAAQLDGKLLTGSRLTLGLCSNSIKPTRFDETAGGAMENSAMTTIKKKNNKKTVQIKNICCCSFKKLT